MSDAPPQYPDHWHLDKRVPISIILALFVQFLGGVWFISKLEARVIALESLMIAQRDRDERQDRTHNEAFLLLRNDIQLLMNKLDRMVENDHRERVDRAVNGKR